MSKGVLMDMEKRIVARAYQLSKGNPIEDTMEIFAKLEAQVTDQGATLKVLGVGTTLTIPGYQALVQELVGREHPRSAAALNGVAMNLASTPNVSPEDFQKYILSEVGVWGDVIAKSGIKVE